MKYMVTKQQKLRIMRTAGVFFTLVCILSAFASCSVKTSQWQSDYDTALSAAQAENKGILLLFTGLGWDTVSTKLKADIFDSEEFIKNAGKSYILLHIDIENIDIAADKETAKNNFILASNMGVQAAPTVLLLTKSGQPFAFVPISTEVKLPADMLKLIKESGRGERRVNVLYKKMQKAQGFDRVKLIDAYVEVIPIQFRPTLTDLASEVLELDPENKTGLLGKFKLQKAIEAVGTAFAQASGFEAALNDLLILIDEPNMLTARQKQDAYYMLGYFSAQSGKVPKDEVIAYMQQAYNAAPDTQEAAQLASLIESLTGTTGTQNNAADTKSGSAAVENSEK